MTLRNTFLTALFIFLIGWFSGFWYARYGSDAAPAAPAVVVAPAAATRAAPPTTLPTGQPPAARSAAGPKPTDAPIASEPPTRAGPPRVPGDAKLNQDEMDFFNKMMARMNEQETIDFQAQLRSEPWASDTEARLRATLADELRVIPGSSLVSADCRTTLCQAVVTAPTTNPGEIGSVSNPHSLTTRLQQQRFGVSSMSSRPHQDSDTTKFTITMRPEVAPPAIPTAAPDQH